MLAREERWRSLAKPPPYPDERFFWRLLIMSQVRRAAIRAPPIRQPTAVPATVAVSFFGTVTTTVVVAAGGPEVVVVLLRDVEVLLRYPEVLLVDVPDVVVVAPPDGVVTGIRTVVNGVMYDFEVIAEPSALVIVTIAKRLALVVPALTDSE